MAKSVVQGVSKVTLAIKKHQRKTEASFEKGLTKAGLWLLRESMTLVPIDTGALRASAPQLTRAEGSGFNTVMIVAYGMHYAVYVHENLNVHHDPGQAKFLEEPARYGRQTMADIVKQEMQR